MSIKTMYLLALVVYAIIGLVILQHQPDELRGLTRLLFNLTLALWLVSLIAVLML